MLECKPLQDRTAKKALASLTGIPYREDTFAYAVYENGTPVGMADAILQGKTGRILHLCSTANCENKKAVSILGQAMIRFLESEHATDVILENGKKDVAESLLMEKRNGKWQISFPDGENHATKSGFL